MWHVFARNTVSLFLNAIRKSILTRLRTIAASVTKLVIFYRIAVGEPYFIPDQIWNEN